ncbi:MAG: hypothetical protein GX945_12675 [Lentisphaerae bacterium]|nr:hypothetical protein [Lentisphaerota bacterium]
MTTKHYPYRLGRLCCLILLLVAPRFAQAQGAAESAEDDWRAERAQIEKEIEQEVQAELDRIVTREGIVRTLTQQWKITPPWAWPIPEKYKPIKAVEEALDEVLKKEADKRFPAKEREKFAVEAKEKYPLYKEGDTVTFTIRGGYGANVEVHGTFMRLSPERLRVGNRWINHRDLDADTSACFYADENARRIEEYIIRENSKYDARIANYIFDEKQMRLPGEFLKANYVPDLRKKNASTKNPNLDMWITRKEAVDILYELQRKIEGDKLRKSISEKKFKAMEYEWVADKKEWMPIYIIEEMREEERRKQEAAQRTAGGDGMPMDGGDMPPPM